MDSATPKTYSKRILILKPKKKFFNAFSSLY